MAYIAQYIFGLLPCALCLYQRVPYFIVLALSLIALFYDSVRKIPLLPYFCASLFFINAIIAFYHMGVEQHWWVSFIKDCAAPKITDLDSLISAPVVRCDSPQWSFLGFTMAQYHILWSLDLTVLTTILAIIFLRKKSDGSTKN
jgi:disulfide bond formation protein DsbB